MTTMKTLLATILLTLPCLAVEDDGDPATGRARFSWVQDPSCEFVSQ